MDQGLLNQSRFSGVKFFVLGDEEIKRGSAAQIFNTTKFNDREPIPDGLYDSRLGTLNSNYTCATCRKDVYKCIGHYGNYQLHYPLAQHQYVKFVQKNMNLICNRCYHYIINPDLRYTNGTLVYKDHPKFIGGVNATYNNILSYMYDKKTSKSTKPIYCDYCNNVDKYLANNSDLKKFYPQFIQPSYKKIKLYDNDTFDKFLTLEELTDFRPESKRYVSNTK